MGCTPSAQQSQSGTAHINGNEGDFTYDQNKNSRNCRITENKSKGKAGKKVYIIYSRFGDIRPLDF